MKEVISCIDIQLGVGGVKLYNMELIQKFYQELNNSY